MTIRWLTAGITWRVLQDRAKWVPSFTTKEKLKHDHSLLFIKKYIDCIEQFKRVKKQFRSILWHGGGLADCMPNFSLKKLVHPGDRLWNTVTWMSNPTNILKNTANTCTQTREMWTSMAPNSYFTVSIKKNIPPRKTSQNFVTQSRMTRRIDETPEKSDNIE